MMQKSEDTAGDLLDLHANRSAARLLVSDVYSLLKDSGVQKYKQWRVSGTHQSVASRISRYRKVKTILNLEKSQDISTFYYPARTRSGVIRDIDSLSPSGNVLLTGIVGQGKSIAMRYMASRELIRAGDRIPLFAELRRVRGRSLIEYILHEMSTLKLEMDVKLFEYLASKSRVTLFLDGFDEIDESDQSRIAEQIEQLATDFPGMRIVVSSRPGSAIANSSIFKVKQLSKIRPDEYPHVIDAMVGTETADEIKKLLSGSTVESVLTTPLMIALLIVRFRVDQTLPQNEFAFYDDLFDLLVRRHDQSKKRFLRKRKSSIGDHEMKQVFDSVCYLTRLHDDEDFNRNYLNGRVAVACKRLGIRVDASKVASDVIEVTNLILEEGGECRFVHKSIQEFHAASFVESLSDEEASVFYKNVYKSGGWEGEIRYLKTMDRLRFERLLLLPVLRLWLRGRNRGLRWFAEQIGISSGTVVDHEAYRRANVLLGGYVALATSSSPLDKVREMRALLLRLEASVATTKATDDEFRLSGG